MKAIGQIAAVNATVMITGVSGVGKAKSSNIISKFEKPLDRHGHFWRRSVQLICAVDSDSRFSFPISVKDVSG